MAYKSKNMHEKKISQTASGKEIKILQKYVANTCIGSANENIRII